MQKISYLLIRFLIHYQSETKSILERGKILPEGKIKNWRFIPIFEFSVHLISLLWKCYKFWVVEDMDVLPLKSLQNRSIFHQLNLDLQNDHKDCQKEVFICISNKSTFYTYRMSSYYILLLSQKEFHNEDKAKTTCVYPQQKH